MSEQGLFERAVLTLAAVSKMTDNVSNDHPERQSIRSMQRVAEYVLNAALTAAMDLVYQAEILAKTVREIESKENNP